MLGIATLTPTYALRFLLLPLLAGGDWEGVAFDPWKKIDPTPALPCKQGREH
jgi:hypothetical protein